MFSNRVKKDLIQHAYGLLDYGVTFESKRSNGQRIIILNYDMKSDSSDGRNLMPEVCENAAPAVPVENSETLENPLNTLPAIGKSKLMQKDPLSLFAILLTLLILLLTLMTMQRFMKSS